jgi:hypothetical protein
MRQDAEDNPHCLQVERTPRRHALHPHTTIRGQPGRRVRRSLGPPARRGIPNRTTSRSPSAAASNAWPERCPSPTSVSNGVVHRAASAPIETVDDISASPRTPARPAATPPTPDNEPVLAARVIEAVAEAAVGPGEAPVGQGPDVRSAAHPPDPPRRAVAASMSQLIRWREASWRRRRAGARPRWTGWGRAGLAAGHEPAARRRLPDAEAAPGAAAGSLRRREKTPPPTPATPTVDPPAQKPSTTCPSDRGLSRRCEPTPPRALRAP